MAVPLPRGKQGEKQANAHNNKTFVFLILFTLSQYNMAQRPDSFSSYQLSVYAVKLLVIIYVILVQYSTNQHYALLCNFM